MQYSFGERQEADDKGSQSLAVLRPPLEVSNDAKHGKGSKILEKDIAAADENGIHDGVGVLGVVGCVGGKITKTNAGGEEDLSNGGLPYRSRGQFAASPSGPEQIDAFPCIRKGARTTDEDHCRDDGQAHCPIDNATGQPNATENGNPDQKPDKGAPADGLSKERNAGILSITGDRLITFGQVAEDGIDIVNNIAHVELLDSVFPRQGTRKRIPKVVHDPRQVDCEVLRDDEAHEYRTQPHALQSSVHAVERDHGSAAIRLADRDLEDERRDRDDDNGDQVRDEPLHAIVVVDDRGIPQQVALSGATAHGSEEEGGARGPLIASVRRLLRRGGEPGAGLFQVPEDDHVWRLAQV